MPEPADLTPEELRRYSRHLIMPEVGAAGQARLKTARVLLVGAGGLGSPAGMYLAAAGVGTLGLVDFDVVDESNLQRQVIYGQSDLGRLKLEAACERLADINPLIRLERHDQRLEAANALEVLSGYDLVVDGSDNFPTRYLVNDACVLAGKPYVYGSIFRFEGQVSVFAAAGGPCYRCLFPEPPPPGLVPSCAEGGVLGVLPGIIGSLQANEAIKLVLGAGRSLAGRLVLFDALELTFRELSLQRDTECAVCGDSPSVTELIDYERFCGIRPEPPPLPGDGFNVEPAELSERLDNERPPRLLDVRTPQEVAICALPGAQVIPIQELPGRLDEIAADAETVVYCHTGVRSAHAVRFLREQGFASTWNLRGGIEAWSREVDPRVPRY